MSEIVNKDIPSLKVTKILGQDKEYSQVILSLDLFSLLKGMKPIYTGYKNSGYTKDGNNIRTFELAEDIKLISEYSKETRKTTFACKTTDAINHMVEREEATLPFDFSIMKENTAAKA